MPTITEKIIQKHLVEGVMERGKPIAIRIDQTLTQDATGTMAYLQLEAMGVDQVKTDLSISYVLYTTLPSPQDKGTLRSPPSLCKKKNNNKQIHR